MYILFEEDGSFKAATILSETDAALQLENASGKRSKIKTAQVLLRYKDPAPQDILKAAEEIASGIDIPFLWECAPAEEFFFADFASDYFGRTPSSVEAAALLLALFGAPVYFHRKGKGRFRRAPEEVLKAALAGLEKKRHTALLIEKMASELQNGHLPEAFTPAAVLQLLYRPDKNKPEYKALEAASTASALNFPELFLKTKALPSTYAYHYEGFLFEQFPKGLDFPEHETPITVHALPEAPLAAFSIDDAATTEIDDAFSVQIRQAGGFIIGIHIAAPALGFSPDSKTGSIARSRLSTVYMPDSKITMLPEDVFMPFSLEEGKTHPALSLYVTVDQAFTILDTESKLENVRIEKNLRLNDAIENPDELLSLPDFAPFACALRSLFDFAKVLEKGRGKPSAKAGLFDYNVLVTGNPHAADAKVEITQRARGGFLDTLVSELMIFTNSTWGAYLAEKKIPALYRNQAQGKVRMSTKAGRHEGLGVANYAWMTSPLRRYVDLVNQWQMIALLQGESPIFGKDDAPSDEMFSALRDFELTYAAYHDFERRMDTYWSLRFLAQEKRETLEAALIKENLCRIDTLPMIARFLDIPELPRGARVLLAIEGMDEIKLQLQARYVKTLVDAPSETAATDEESEEA